MSARGGQDVAHGWQPEAALAHVKEIYRQPLTNDNNTTMPKRKRDFEEPAPSTNRGSAKQQRVERKLEVGTRKLAHAFKVAKGFERQKLGRREKTAKAAKNDSGVLRIEAEIAALKTLDTLASAQLYLHKSLSKIKAVTTSELFSGWMSNPQTLQDNPAAQNIHARLCNSKPVKEALATSLEDVLQAAHIESHSKKSNAKAVQQKEPEPVPDEVPEDDLASDMSDVSDGAFNKYQHRLASSSDEEDLDSEADDISKLERQLLSEGIEHDSGSDDDSDFDDFDAQAPSKPRKSAISKTERAKSSMILPSLTLGGYISASDGSEVEEIDVAPRKNRPGQRARQAIWEKKFGQKAKHLQDTGKSRDQGWDAKRGATRDSRRGARNFGQDGGRTTAPEPKPRKKDDTGPLHPSWVAAKLAKEKKGSIPAFTGTKISFD